MSDRLLLIITELLNFITNLFALLMPVVMLVCEICGVPDKTLAKIKEVEHKLFNAYGTKEVIDEFLQKK